MKRLGWTVLSIAVLLFWLIGSYWLPSWVLLPKLTFAGLGFESFFINLSLVLLVTFALIQVWIGISTVRALRRRVTNDPSLPANTISVGIGWETVLTLLPIFMTGGLIWLSLQPK